MVVPDVIVAVVMVSFAALFGLDSGPGRAAQYAFARWRRSRQRARKAR
jgi:hypothetical protein